MLYLELFILIITLSLDTLIASISMGIEKIRVSIVSILILNTISSIFLAISCLCGNTILTLFNNNTISYLPNIIIILIGVSKIIKPVYKKITSKNNGFDIKGLFKIYYNPEKADLDNSKTLSIKEIILLSITLSFDNLIAGSSLGFCMNFINLIILFNFFFGSILFFILNRLFLRINLKSNIDISFISGIIFILVGISRIII